MKKSALSEYEEKLHKSVVIHRMPLIHIESSDYESEDLGFDKILSNKDLPYDYNCKLGWTSSLLLHNYDEWCYALRKNRVFDRRHIIPIESEDKEDSVISNLINVIRLVFESEEPMLLVIKGIHNYLSSEGDNREVLSILSSMLYLFYITNKNKPINRRSQIIIIAPRFDIPIELQGCLFRLTPPFPDEEDIERELGLDNCSWEQLSKQPVRRSNTMGDTIKYSYNKFFWNSATGENNKETFNSNKKKLISLFKGMRIRDIIQTLSYNDYTIESINMDSYREYKERMVRDSGLLQVEDVEDGYERYVGDIDSLVDYIKERKRIIDNRSFYNPRMALPKGILLVGPPGCGKSEATKAIASILQMPLLSFDMGKLLSKWSGESEHNFEDAIKIAEAAQPCVLRIDEIEKAFAGAGENDSDQSLTRIIGHFLTWMQERKSMVYIVATANNLELMRPEFLRKGRWDEIFYLSYPSPKGAIKIIDSCLRRYNFTLDNWEKLQSEFFSAYSKYPNMKLSGAELSDMVIQSYQAAFIKEPEDEKGNLQLKADIMINQLELALKKNRNIEEEEKAKAEMLAFDIEWERQRSSQITDEQINKMKSILSGANFRKDEIEKQIKQIQLNAFLGSFPQDEEKKEKIRELLKEKYAQYGPKDKELLYQSRGYLPASNIGSTYGKTIE